MNDTTLDRPAVPSAVRYDLRRAESRGRLRLDWLDARFSFSFGPYRDPARERFGPLLALNDDRVQPGTGFAMHPHRDLEIMIVPLAGRVEHRDDQGRHGIVEPGQSQFMRAGRGIRHSQTNPSRHEIDHHLQIWIEPRRRGLEPAVEQRSLPPAVPGCWRVVADPDGVDGGFRIDQDARVLLGEAGCAAPLSIDIRAGRSLYLHVAGGELLVALDGPAHTLQDGDALALFVPPPRLVLRARAWARVLAFDVPAVAAP